MIFCNKHSLISTRGFLQIKNQCENILPLFLSLDGITIQLSRIPTGTMLVRRWKKSSMKRETNGRIPVPTKGIAPARYSRLSRCPFLSKVCQIGGRHVTEAFVFFQNAFQRDSRLSRAICLRAGNRGKITRDIRGTRCATGRRGWSAYPSGHIMHRG